MRAEWEYALNFLCAVKHAEYKHKKELDEFDYKNIYAAPDKTDFKTREKCLEYLVDDIEQAWRLGDEYRVFKYVKALYVTMDAEKYRLDYERALRDLSYPLPNYLFM